MKPEERAKQLAQRLMDVHGVGRREALRIAGRHVSGQEPYWQQIEG